MAEEGFSTPSRGRKSTVGEVVDARRVISKLHSLAMDPRNRPFIARDEGCLRNIIKTFDNASEDVVYKALETISYLCSHSAENIELLSQFPGLVDRLQSVAELHPNEEVTSLAHFIIKKLSKPIAPSEDPHNSASTPSKSRTALQSMDINVRNQRPVEAPSPATKAIQSRAPKNFMFRVEGLNGEEEKDRLERTLIRVKGVISVSLDNVEFGDIGLMRILATKRLNVRAVVRAKCSADHIISSCEKAEFQIDLIESAEVEHTTPNKAASREATDSGYETPLSGQSTQMASSDSPRYLTPPELASGDDRVLVNIQDTVVGTNNSKELSWIQKVGRVLWW